MTSLTQIFFHVMLLWLLLLVFAEEPWVPAGEGDSVILGVLPIGQSSLYLSFLLSNKSLPLAKASGVPRPSRLHLP